jgi:hypothetical protein
VTLVLSVVRVASPATCETVTVTDLLVDAWETVTVADRAETVVFAVAVTVQRHW